MLIVMEWATLVITVPVITTLTRLTLMVMAWEMHVIMMMIMMVSTVQDIDGTTKG